jgi:type II secretory pathway predicted ATPase ExeA
MNAQTYRSFFAFTQEPFGADLRIEDLWVSPALQGVKDRLDYSFRLGALAVVTGEVGAGKSTALRYATSHLHPSEWRLLWVTASCGSILELGSSNGVKP